jgi:ABC-type transport system involved in multi-copper enzyme maturation permease subunit
MNRVATAFWNPIVAKEYRSRMRTWKSPLAMMVYILLIGGFGFLVFSVMAYANSGLSGGSNYGQILFSALIGFQVILLTFVTPALTAGAISSERERQTLDLLFVTRIQPFSIIWGKLLASMSFVFLLLILSVPIFSLVFLFGGIELDQVVYAFLVTLVTAMTLGVMGIAFSTWLRRSLVATVVSYVAAFVLLVGTLGFGLFFPTDIDPKATKTPAPPAVTYLSPVMALAWIAGDGQYLGFYGVRSPNNTFISGSGSGAQTVCQTTVGGGTTCYSGGSSVPIGGKGGFVQIAQTASGAIPSGLFEGWQYWQATIVMQLAICLVALLASAFLLPPVRRLPWRRRNLPEPAPAVSN